MSVVIKKKEDIVQVSQPVPHERIQALLGEQIAPVPVPQITEDIGVAVQPVPSDRIQE